MLLYKILLIGIFAAAVISLASAMVFIIRGDSKKKRIANSLLIRVSLCGILAVLIVYGIYAGYIQPHSPVGLAK